MNMLGEEGGMMGVCAGGQHVGVLRLFIFVLAVFFICVLVHGARVYVLSLIHI